MDSEYSLPTWMAWICDIHVEVRIHKLGSIWAIHKPCQMLICFGLSGVSSRQEFRNYTTRGKDFLRRSQHLVQNIGINFHKNKFDSEDWHMSWWLKMPTLAFKISGKKNKKNNTDPHRMCWFFLHLKYSWAQSMNGLTSAGKFVDVDKDSIYIRNLVLDFTWKPKIPIFPRPIDSLRHKNVLNHSPLCERCVVAHDLFHHLPALVSPWFSQPPRLVGQPAMFFAALLHSINHCFYQMI